MIYIGDIKLINAYYNRVKVCTLRNIGACC